MTSLIQWVRATHHQVVGKPPSPRVLVIEILLVAAVIGHAIHNFVEWVLR